MSDLDGLEDWVGVLLNKLEPAARISLAQGIAKQLRRSQQQRITSQRTPSGSAFAPRKQRNLRSKQGRIQLKAKMFKKLRTARYLKAKGDANAITVGFTGRIARIARVHQYGLKDHPGKGAADVRYAKREQLGFTAADLEMVRDSLLRHLAD
ncbi:MULTISPECIES: phage virion morphogenesis protein [unclassified Pseudomonas]|uniref:phage virion morphogenesis protein n=1 Tax=unclassified Pseudomonas TaxID=196821 RepID=UPI002B223B4D|nr:MULTISPECIES: phage virion morphogenesis protein [unclassified Pseudomonas]MEA9976665.1 phage virion morphogenesis protein [Pseudomonas sp. RTS4]MEB0195770.1 phage virion morphogenesis protein [Pseudomonas sp. 5S4]MEB0244739.1 phage virion morphogenesis protein [Pseudomonas sp. 10S5]